MSDTSYKACDKQQDFVVVFFKNFVFTEELKFNIIRLEGKIVYLPKSNDNFNPKHLISIVKHADWGMTMLDNFRFLK